MSEPQTNEEYIERVKKISAKMEKEVVKSKEEMLREYHDKKEYYR